MQLTIHRGTHEIGGSCVEIVSGKTRIILDVGLPLVDASREPFEPRSIQGKTVDELLAERTLPRVAGLFGPGQPPDAILLSHSHLDHSGLLHLSKPEIPIYASKGTSKMMLVAGLFAGQQALDRNRHKTVSAQQSFTIGDFQITPFAVDHSAFGALAFLVEADGKCLLYSGDLRWHGRKPGMMKTLIEQIAPKKIDVLLIEGTHFGSGREIGLTEYELEDQMVEQIKSAPGIVLAAFSPSDVDRLVTFYKAAQRSDRVFVVDAYTAFVLYMVASETKVPQPTVEAGMRVYFNRAFEKPKYERISQLFQTNRIALNEILAEPAKYVMVFRPSMTKLDFAGQLPALCRCLYSYWAGYLKNPDWVELQERVAQAKGDFVPAHTSGHIYIKDLIQLVKALDPKRIVPIHTFEPQAFQSHFNNVQVLDDGQSFQVG